MSDAIGIIGLDDLQLIIDPKIPLSHLLYLLVESNQVPRSLYERSSLGVDDSFFTDASPYLMTPIPGSPNGPVPNTNGLPVNGAPSGGV